MSTRYAEPSYQELAGFYKESVSEHGKTCIRLTFALQERQALLDAVEAAMHELTEGENTTDSFAALYDVLKAAHDKAKGQS